jgi:hypothetical protein
MLGQLLQAITSRRLKKRLIAALIETGDYKCVELNVRRAAFQGFHEPAPACSIELLEIPQGESIQELLQYMLSHGYCPADPVQVLAAAAADHSFGHDFMVVSFVWVRSFTVPQLNALCIQPVAGGRAIGYLPVTHRWPMVGPRRFACTRWVSSHS